MTESSSPDAPEALAPAALAKWARDKARGIRRNAKTMNALKPLQDYMRWDAKRFDAVATLADASPGAGGDAVRALVTAWREDAACDKRDRDRTDITTARVAYGYTALALERCADELAAALRQP